MKEELVSKELAIMAKKKGFDYPTTYSWCKQGGWNKYTGKEDEITFVLRTNGNPFGQYCTGNNWNKKYESNKNKIVCSAPTQSLLAKWLREVHNIHVTSEYIATSKTYIALVRSYDPYRACSLGIWKNYNYEQALEKGLSYALEYLKSTNNNDIQ